MTHPSVDSGAPQRSLRWRHRMFGLVLTLALFFLLAIVVWKYSEAVALASMGSALLLLGFLLARTVDLRTTNAVGNLAEASDGLVQRGKELAASKERLARILDATPSGIIEISAEGAVTYANRMLLDLFGMHGEALIGRRYRDLVASASDTHGVSLDLEELPLARALKGESTNGFEQVLTTKSGRRVTLSVNAEPLRSPDGAIIGALGTVADVSARVAADQARLGAEARLRTIVDTVPVGILLAQAHGGRIVESNMAIESMLRRPVLSEASFKPDEWVAAHEDGSPVDQAEWPLARALSGAEPRPELECNFRRGDGTYAWLKFAGAPLRNEADEITGAVVAIVDIDQIKQIQAHQRLMNKELHHRVGNTLATVQAIANLTARSATNIEAFRKTFADRIVSLSRTHTLLVETSWAHIPLRALAELELHPYQSEGNRQVTIDGPDIRLPSDAALALGMTIHELTTNAIKFGALSVSTGLIELKWQVELANGGRNLKLQWRESGGPTVRRPVRTGFGSQLLTNILARQLKGDLSLDFAPDGMRVDITLPI